MDSLSVINKGYKGGGRKEMILSRGLLCLLCMESALLGMDMKDPLWCDLLLPRSVLDTLMV